MVRPFYIKNKPLGTNGVKPKHKVTTLFEIGSPNDLQSKDSSYKY